jgi:hypothetical protein
MTDGPVSPPTPIAVIEVSDDEVTEILDDDDDDDDDDDPPGTTSTASEYRMNMSCDGRAIPVIQVTTIAATEDRQNYWGDLNGHWYDVRQVAKSVAVNSKISQISGAIVPGSSVDSSSSSMSVHSSVAPSHSQPSVSGTARGSLLKSHLTSEKPQVGSAYPDQVPRVAQQMGNKVSCFIIL